MPSGKKSGCYRNARATNGVPARFFLTGRTKSLALCPLSPTSPRPRPGPPISSVEQA